MAVIQNVNRIDDFVKIQKVLVSCTDKTGLISNKGMSEKNFPENGLVGRLAEINPDILFISTGNTYSYLKKLHVNVIDMSEYTKYPEMKTGLVKSLHPKIHAGILGHIYTLDDKNYMLEHDISPIDLVIVNFYDLQKEIKSNSDVESKRQAIDIGGPTLCHAARKSFINTALLVDPADYNNFIKHVESNEGNVSLACRLKMAKKASRVYTELMNNVDDIVQSITIEQLKKCYDIL